ncbi:MAG TPA: DUF4397 domain-containing protein [Gemmatimonadales bacterium]|nr:DUF4397 domain-containing protein [Gemmatimonadales bacterium]
MISTRNFWSGFAAGSALLFAVACNESRDTGSVTTQSSQGTSVAPDAESVEGRDNALVRVVNAIPGSPASIYADDSVAFESVAYKAVSEWEEMPDDFFGFKVVQVGQSIGTDTLAENREKLSNGGHYTIVALPEDRANPSQGDEYGDLRVLDDELKPMTEGKARVRFINAVAGLETDIDVIRSGDNEALVEGVNYGNEAGWNDEDPWTGALEVRLDGNETALATIPAVEFQAGRSYTFIFAGTPESVEVIRFSDDVHPQMDADDKMMDAEGAADTAAAAPY